MKLSLATDEKELLLRLRKGDHIAFELLYNKYYQSLTGHLIRLLKSTELAKEVVQDTFMAVWEHRDRIDTERPLKSYIFKTATNNTFNIFKKAAYDEKYRAYLFPIIEVGYEHIEARVFEKENEQMLGEIMQRMSKKQREVFVLCKLQGKSYEEAGKELNISTNTIHTHIKRANLFIKESLSRYPEFVTSVIISVSFGLNHLN
ncbi:RNA polymerase sigma factor [Chryseobacterium lathyri]|uniref:DNA-directed RNA polymerase sigma-70 factor n=1 Tax=Chryseobacterium lathyri TaxID=395933 RepID=A0A511Y7K1_9FLAO|nr:sigma-70 family RNA polymerase sigma factor [Chryseobacterium lathyri]GEN71169.1 DNA-directed RNA polymerase sigma-70 factor [Chryseobacterium lathyri]